MPGPEARPLHTVQELLQWNPEALPQEQYCRAGVPYRARLATQPGRPKLLACHDMQGGYASDRFAQGTSTADAYRLAAWHLLDIFVYFSHNFVTIPPPTWLNAAHRNHVPILGTFITEWDHGTTICEQLLVSEDSAADAAHQLALIAAHYGFEGWLVNVESTLPAALVPNLLHFEVHDSLTPHRVLRDEMRRMVEGSLVIWYDAVTTEGLLQWQDTLNRLNQPFFDVADAIFINYTWKAWTPPEAALAAGDRQADVFMGIDVFGRNTYAGGGYDSYVALQTACDAGLSAALFAPGWVWEQGERATWEERSQRFWDLLESVWPAKPWVTNMPFATSFDCGAGLAVYQMGRLIKAEPWYNLSCMGLQPRFQCASVVRFNFLHGDGNDEQTELLGGSLAVELTAMEAHVDFGNAFNGGSSLLLTGELAGGASVVFDLFGTRFEVPPAGLSVEYTACLPPAGAKLVLQLALSPAQHPRGKAIDEAGQGPPSVLHITPDGVQEEQGGWETRSYCIGKFVGYEVDAVAVVCSNSEGGIQYEARLGEVRIQEAGMEAASISISATAASNIRTSTAPSTSASPETCKALGVDLSWRLDQPADCCHVWWRTSDREPSWLGVAHCECYRVEGLRLPEDCGQIEFTVQPWRLCRPCGVPVAAMIGIEV